MGSGSCKSAKPVMITLRWGKFSIEDFAALLNAVLPLLNPSMMTFWLLMVGCAGRLVLGVALFTPLAVAETGLSVLVESGVLDGVAVAV